MRRSAVIMAVSSGNTPPIFFLSQMTVPDAVTMKSPRPPLTSSTSISGSSPAIRAARLDARGL